MVGPANNDETTQRGIEQISRLGPTRCTTSGAAVKRVDCAEKSVGHRRMQKFGLLGIVGKLAQRIGIRIQR